MKQTLNRGHSSTGGVHQLSLRPPGAKTISKCAEVYAGFVAGQIEAGSQLREADLMSSMAMDGVARIDYRSMSLTAVLWRRIAGGTAAGLALTGRKPFVHTFTALPAVAVLISSSWRWIISVTTSKVMIASTMPGDGVP
ncbi:hypothetical protein KCP76_01395 [Salmonella enterica subsp. enterica serovar Weltevreden]|nr:hypothetical protein KCP76_01395 [Salmonella enterica subsp. enterica serovar Weltevreden]